MLVSVAGKSLGTFSASSAIHFADYAGILNAPIPGSVSAADASVFDGTSVTEFDLVDVTATGNDFPLLIDGGNSTGSFTITTTPEPSGMLLFFAGVAVLGRRSRRANGI